MAAKKSAQPAKKSAAKAPPAKKRATGSAPSKEHAASKVEGLLQAKADVPLVHLVHAFEVHLESIVPEDQDGLERVTEQLTDWLGPNLRWTYNSAFGLVEPYRDGDLGYIANRPTDLKVVTTIKKGFETLQTGFEAVALEDFLLHCHGGAQSAHGSPWQARFHSLITKVHADRYDSASTLRVTVPLSWPAEDLLERALRMASSMRIRWATLGPSYAGWETQWRDQHRKPVFQHAQSHPNFDVDVVQGMTLELHKAIRSVNWITMVGPSLRKRAKLSDKVPAGAERFEHGDLLVLRAASLPDTGDSINAGYAWADRSIKSLRLPSQQTFGSPWGPSSTERWLSRYEGKR